MRTTIHSFDSMLIQTAKMILMKSTTLCFFILHTHTITLHVFRSYVNAVEYSSKIHNSGGIFMKTLIALSLVSALITSCAYAEPVKHSQCYDLEELTVLDKQDVGGGKGTLYGEFAFIRDNAREQDAIKEIGFMTLKPGSYIGLHSHADNEDAYLILSG